MSDQRDDAVTRRTFRGSWIAMAMGAVVIGSLAYWFSRPAPPPRVNKSELSPAQVRELPPIQPPQVKFTDITNDAGITYTHNNGARGEKLLPETMGGGCAVLDFDNDGRQDILFVNSQHWSEETRRGEPASTLTLYHNDGDRFSDVTEGSGLGVSLYGMGAAVGDFDNDGLVDIFVTAVGPNHLFRNLGGGRFEDVTETAGLAGEDDRWSTSAGWFDYDNDGDLDLFVCNYVEWSREYDLAQNFQLIGGGRAYGRPQNFEGVFPYLYRNDGDGQFADVSEAAGVQVRHASTGAPLAKSLGLAIADLDGDGYLDLIVANDTVQNLLLRNTGMGTFQELGVLSGIAFDNSGNVRGAMGVDVTPIRNSSAMAIAIGNFSNEMTALYVARRGSLQFFDEAISTGLGPNTRLELTFGVFFFDYDLDGRWDLFCSNGHLEEEINRVQPNQHYEQPPQLFWNAGTQQGTEFVRVGAKDCGPDLLRPMVGRGAAYADFDGDGDLDILITATGGPPRLLRNELANNHHWLRIKLVGDGEACNRDAIGSWVEVTLGERVLRQQVMPTRSYLSQVELPITFGLGESEAVDEVTVRWPDGLTDTLGRLEVNRLHTLHRGVTDES